MTYAGSRRRVCATHNVRALQFARVRHASGAGSCQAPTIRMYVWSNCVRTKYASSGSVPDMSLLSNSICRCGVSQCEGGKQRAQGAHLRESVEVVFRKV